MIRRPFGSTGTDVPAIGQGTWKLRDANRAEAALRVGLSLGLTHIDTAELYRGSEEVIARALRGWRRDDVWLVSKVLPHNASYQGTLDACNASLRRLGTGRVDVYLLHWWGEHPIEDTMRAMGELADAGKTRFVGVSNLDVEQLEQAQEALGKKHRIVCDQVLYHLQARDLEVDLLPYCKQKDIAVVGYSTFGSESFPGGAKAKALLADIGRPLGLSAHQVVLNFLATRDDSVFLIPKAENEQHVRANASALDVALPKEAVRRIDEAFPVPESVEELPSL